MDFSTSAVFFLFLTYHLHEAKELWYNSILSVPNGGQWGELGKIEFCHKGYAKGFSLKVHQKQGYRVDDTGLNGIRLFCSYGGIIQSSIGKWGAWTEFEICPKGFLVSFALKVESSQGPFDDTAANNIQFKCQDGTILEGNSTDFGTYGPWSERCKAGSICGIQTSVQPPSDGDNTALNDVKFYCCN